MSLTMLSLSLNKAAEYQRVAYATAANYAELCEASKEAKRLRERLQEASEDAWMVNLPRVLPKLKE